MNIEVLVATMHQTDTDLIKKMNLKTNAVVINQTDKVDYKEIKSDNTTVRFFSFNERGVGLSRNSALMRSSADICVLADDDMVFSDHYEETVSRAFSENPQADVIIFNLIEEGASLNRQISSPTKINILNYMNYG
ncbi:MAG: glycosyltransferase family 2 protein, partial [Clostridia bacterium]|nr:glycosyltransferase family 2 protein [Clostridia bacterium]